MKTEQAFAKLLQTGIHQKMIPQRTTSSLTTHHWSASFFQLDKSRLFNSLTEEKKNQIITQLNYSVIHELTEIEKVGTRVAQSIAEASTSVEEQMLYVMISGEEVNHYYALASYLPPEILARPKNEFVHIIETILNAKEKDSFNFIVQILLEGFALYYFQNLRKNCQTIDLQLTMDMIIQDEARHHGTGVVTFKNTDASSKNQKISKSAVLIKNLLQLFQIGPVTLLKTIESIAGDVGAEERVLFMYEIGSEQTAQGYLNMFKKLMIQAEAHQLVQQLETENIFTAFSSLQTESLYQGLK